MESENKKEYEISFLAYGEEGAGAVIGHLSQLEAEIIGEGPLESITLAYPIKKHTNADFGYIHFRMNPEMVDKLKEALKFEKGLLRYLVVTPPFAREDTSQTKKSGEGGGKSEVSEGGFRDGALSNEDLEAKLEEISEFLPDKG